MDKGLEVVGEVYVLETTAKTTTTATTWMNKHWRKKILLAE